MRTSEWVLILDKDQKPSLQTISLCSDSYEDFCHCHELENQVITVFSNFCSTDYGFCCLAVVADNCMTVVVEVVVLRKLTQIFFI